MEHNPFYTLLIQFVNILLRTFASIFRRDIGLNFCFLMMSSSGLGIRIIVLVFY